MKFKLVEDILLEKRWIKITNSEDKTIPPVYFFTKTAKRDKDFKSTRHDIENILNPTASFRKQSINHQALKHLKKLSDTGKYLDTDQLEFEEIRSIEGIDPEFILTFQDRELRKNAQLALEKSKESIQGLPDSKFLIHHKSGKEFDNDVNNLILTEYTDSPELANVVHQLLHKKSNIITGTDTVNLFDIENNVAIPYRATLSIEKL